MDLSFCGWWLVKNGFWELPDREEGEEYSEYYK
jgi:hypothetical protein